MNNELVHAIERMFDDFTVHPSGAYVIEHMQDTVFVYVRKNPELCQVTFPDANGSSSIYGDEAKIANALRDWRNRPQL